MKSKEILEIENELGKTSSEYFAQEYIPPPTVEDAVEAVTLVGECLNSYQVTYFVREVVKGLVNWIVEDDRRQLDGIWGIELVINDEFVNRLLADILPSVITDKVTVRAIGKDVILVEVGT